MVQNKGLQLKVKNKFKNMRLSDKYKSQITKQLSEELGISNMMAIPSVTKIVVNVGLGRAIQDKSLIDKATDDLTKITGQKPKVCQARKSVASFKLRAGLPIGLQVTLRNEKMYDFMEKLFNLVLPRLRDFKGVKTKSFDGQGNYTLGLEEQIVFPEIDYGKIDAVRGLEITFVTTAKSDEVAFKLLSLLGMPFAKK